MAQAVALERQAPDSVPRELRLSRVAIAVLASALFSRSMLFLVSNGSPAQRIIGGVLSVAVLALYMLASTTGPLDRRHRWAVGVMAFLVYCPLAFLGVWWTTTVVFLAAMSLGLLPRPYSFAVFALVVAGEVPVALLLGDDLAAALYTSLWVTVGALPLYGLTRFAENARILYETRAELVAAEVDGQRVRIAGELQVLLGERLAEISVRGDRGLVRVGGDAERLREELRGILKVARDAQREMREFAHREQRLEVGRVISQNDEYH